MLLPLYQGKGEDGFFIARPLRTFWLHLSAFLRRIRIGAFLHWLPGVHRSVDQCLDLTIDTRIARWYPLEVFHLFGYRKEREAGNTLVVTRRAFDSNEPETIRL